MPRASRRPARIFAEEDAMAWVLLLVAGVLEVAWAIGLKHAQGLERPLVLAATLAAMAASTASLSASAGTPSASVSQSGSITGMSSLAMGFTGMFG